MTAGPLGAALRRRVQIGPRARIWLFTSLLAGSVAVLSATMLPARAAAVEFPVDIPWAALAAAFALTELAVIHTQPDRESISFSLTELVLVIGLFVSEPAALVSAQVVGAGVVFSLHRRQAPIKLAFNLSLYALTATLATITFAAVVGTADPVSSRGWAAALVAVLVGTVVTELAMFYTIGTAEERLDWRRLLDTMAVSIPFTQGSAAIGLVGVSAMTHDPLSLLLLLVPAFLVLLSYRSFSRARRERLNMAFLYEISTLLHRGGYLEPALSDFLSASRTAFRAEIAELTMLGPAGDVTITRSTEGAAPSVLASVVPTSDHHALIQLTEDGTVVRSAVSTKRGDGPLNRYARRRGFKTVMAVAVGGGRLHGALLVANRYGDVATFDSADAALFGSLAHQVGQILDNGHLEQSLRQVTELKEQLAHRAWHDSLTGLANRAHFVEKAQQALDHARAAGSVDEALSVLYIDLDGFKEVNDSLGHDAGDALLEVVASRLRTCVRSTDLVARFGGDEFAVLLVGDEHDRASAPATAERIRTRLGDPVDLGGRLAMVGASVGVATSTPQTSSIEDLIRCADTAMYSAKHAGGRQHALYRPSLHDTARPRYSAAELARAIEQDEIEVRYQPIVDLDSTNVVGVEALVRWRHPTDGELAPADFIPLAERSQLISALGRRVLAQACLDASQWSCQPGATDLFLAVNLSGVQLADPGLVEDVTSALEYAGLSPSSLMLEITETTLMRDQHAAAETLGTLKRLGVKIAVDDFGTGYSSLAYLRRFPVDMLKIASEFTHGIDTTAHESDVTHAIIQLAATLGLRTVAEGIETATQHRHLSDLRCSLGQGYRFSHPVTASHIRTLLSRQAPQPPITAA